MTIYRSINAVAESFWESLKRECLQGRVFATRAEARRAIFRWINWYNTT
ncbi:MAG: transposase, partial [Acidimicrobiia bacterium]|nr:transposase [Acidimicrobiia bacterium]